MEPLELLRSWNGASIVLGIHSATLPMRIMYGGLLRFAVDKHLTFHVDAHYEPDGTIAGGPGITIAVALDKADVRFSAHSTNDEPVIKIVLKGAVPTSGRDDFIEIGPTLRFG